VRGRREGGAGHGTGEAALADGPADIPAQAPVSATAGRGGRHRKR
jgi:hypothetical protein